MDIIDIMLAKAMTPQGQTDIYVNKANKAAQDAAQAKQDALDTIATVTSAATDIADTQAAASLLLEDAQAALEAALEAAESYEGVTIEDVDTEINKTTLEKNNQNTSNYVHLQIQMTLPDGETIKSIDGIAKLYKSTGNNEDGGMTQKAITEALSSYTGGSGNANIHFDRDDSGHIIVIDENGNVIASNVTEDNLIDILINSSNYLAKDAVGLDMNYEDKVFTRLQLATNLTMGEDFNQFPMYGGRIKCNVSDNGTINAFFGDNNYTEDGSNGLVMIYLPKFYYRRTPSKFENMQRGRIIRHESLLLSATELSGFKTAPVFYNNVDYVLLPAYDASLSNNVLCSVANALPISNISIGEAEFYATNRGEGWHIVNFAAEATNLMLEIVEFGMMNGQTAIELGIVQGPSSGTYTCYFITGSTASLGNGTGHATETQVNINGTVSTRNTAGLRAITYRGMENPWGNLWLMIGGVNIYGNGERKGGTAYICTDFNYLQGEIGDNYEDIGFDIASQYKWINAMGLGNNKYDWVFLPAECSNTANSLLPVGDSIWAINGLNGINILASGGSYGFGDECGPFYYAVDRNAPDSSRPNYGVKLMYIPTKNNIYYNNINKWHTHMGG